MSEYAVLNANYLKARLEKVYKVPHGRICMHEFVAEGRFEGSDVRALDISKRLMDYKFHPPTNYFPLIVHEALMIEPTETENKDTLDAFADALIHGRQPGASPPPAAVVNAVAQPARHEPRVLLLEDRPHDAPAGHLHERSYPRLAVGDLHPGLR